MLAIHRLITDQAAFSPSHLIPYIEPSADPVLQSRLFSYPDTHRHRLGTNYQQLPVNAPIVPVANFQRDGPQTFVSQGARPNYQSSISPLSYKGKKATLDGNVRDAERTAKHENFIGSAYRDLSEITERECEMFSRGRLLTIWCFAVDFEQPRALWSNVWNDQQREAYVQNVAGNFGNVKSPEVKARQREFTLLYLIPSLLTWKFFSICMGRCRSRLVRPYRQGSRTSFC